MTRKLILRLLALTLSLLLPVCTLAEGSPSPTIIVAASDFQGFPSDGMPPDDILISITARIAQDFPRVDGVLFAGDYSRDAIYDAAPGIALIEEILDHTGWGDADTVYCQGNHDLLQTGPFANGPIEADTYCVYVIREDDFPQSPYNDFRVRNVSELLKVWLDGKIAAGYDRPIFILTHLPLHYTTRGDNSYAALLFDVINAAGAQGLNIIFLSGHNHSSTYDYEIGYNICLLPGDEIYVMDGSADESGIIVPCRYEHLTFTYMNAGYVSADVGGEVQSMTVFVIDEEAVTIYRYSADGPINLKSPGSQKRLNLASYKSTYPSPQILPLTGPDNEQK